jgi:hypothetical protein
MDVNIQDIEINVNGEIWMVNLRWMRGASRYNNGGRAYGWQKEKYPFRLICGRLKDKLRKDWP